MESSIMTLSKPSTKDPMPSPDDPLCTVEDRLYVSRALDLARYATEHGGEPFGALLFCEGEVIAEYSNCVRSTGDLTKHAECGLISAFSPKIDRDKFLKCTLYTSTEPCAMCCGAIYCAGIGRVVYGTGQGPLLEIFGEPVRPNPLRSREILARISPHTRVFGPLMEAEGIALHKEYWPGRRALDSIPSGPSS
jgi:tRNA(Arg) A34 adenosine deaminase TadA